MIENILDNLRISASNDDFDSRRVHERRHSDSCIAVIDGQSFHVENWSQGGVLVKGDTRPFAVDEIKDLTIKFKTVDKVVNIEHRGRVLRKGVEQFVIQFSPLTYDVDRKFQQVIDDHMANEFANSHM
ncbi:MAG: PilZ domain-containing protein [Pseudomonadota bacterium]